MRSWEGIEEVVAIADTGSFVGAAHKLTLSASHISRAVERIEARVGTKLFERTTRSVRLTDAGHAIVERCRRLVEDRDETLRAVRTQDEMDGKLRITCSVALGERFVEPLVREFMQDYPRIAVWIELTNRVVDVVGESFDVAIRTGHPSDDRLAARQIASRSIIVLASPDYLARKGVPRHPDDIAAHDCLIGTSPTWHFVDDGNRLTVVPTGLWRCNNGDSVVQAALSGLGLCQLPEYFASSHLAAGQLTSVLDRYRDDPEPIWAVYPSRRIQIPRVRRFVAMLEDRLGTLTR
jgi:DNA-binding transcriptional LysR family regulator